MIDELPVRTPEPGTGRAVSVMLVTGEASGDEHGALLVAAIRRREPAAAVFGMGGSHVRAAGMETVVDSEEHASVMGLTELAGKLRSIGTSFRTLLRAASERKPDVVVLIDFPDFNLRLAKALKRRGFEVVYFITPQVWAWRRYRVRAIRRDFRKVLPIFPFEESFFHQHGVDAEYIGHPFLDRPPVTRTRAEILAAVGLNPALPVLAMLPGSRSAEVDRLLPVMVEAFQRLRQARPGLQAVVPVASTLSETEMRNRIGPVPGLKFVRGGARELLAAANAAIVASGTVTVEAALAKVPFVVVYRLSPFSYRIARLLVRGVRHFAMVNLIAGRRVVPEILQDEVTPERLAAEVERLFGDPTYRAAILRGLTLVADRLSAGRPEGYTSADRAAEVVIECATGAGREQMPWRAKVGSRKRAA